MLDTPTRRAPWTRVPYRWYTDADVYAREQERIFRGRAWNYAALACEIPKHGDFKTSTIGDAPIQLQNQREARVTMHLLEGSREEIERQLRSSIEAFFDFYPEI